MVREIYRKVEDSFEKIRLFDDESQTVHYGHDSQPNDRKQMSDRKIILKPHKDVSISIYRRKRSNMFGIF